MLTQQEVGKKITEIRKAQKMTQEEFGKQINVADATISKWENGLIEPGFMKVAALAEQFNLSLDQLFLKKNHAA